MLSMLPSMRCCRLCRSTSAARRCSGRQRATPGRQQRLGGARSGLLGRLGSCRQRWIRSRSSSPPCRWVVVAAGWVHGGAWQSCLDEVWLGGKTDVLMFRDHRVAAHIAPGCLLARLPFLPALPACVPLVRPCVCCPCVPLHACLTCLPVPGAPAGRKRRLGRQADGPPGVSRAGGGSPQEAAARGGRGTGGRVPPGVVGFSVHVGRTPCYACGPCILVGLRKASMRAQSPLPWPAPPACLPACPATRCATVQIEALERQCQSQAAELRSARQQHEGVLEQLGREHAAQVASLETQLVAAERCSAELKEVTAALGSVRQGDVDALKVGPEQAGQAGRRSGAALGSSKLVVCEMTAAAAAN